MPRKSSKSDGNVSIPPVKLFAAPCIVALITACCPLSSSYKT
jgi:hypothetical protein